MKKVNLCLRLIFYLGIVATSHSTPMLSNHLESGDALLDESQKLDKHVFKRSAKEEKVKITRMVRKKWPGGILPYELDCSFKAVDDSIYFIYRAMDIIENRTCLRFVPRKPEDKTYLWFTRNHGCFARIGYWKNRKIQVSLGRDCEYYNHALHEIGHAIGFLHTKWVKKSVRSAAQVPTGEVFGKILDIDKINEAYGCENRQTVAPNRRIKVESINHFFENNYVEKNENRPSPSHDGLIERTDIKMPDEKYVGRICENLHWYCKGWARDNWYCHQPTYAGRVTRNKCLKSCKKYLCDNKPIKPEGQCTNALGIGRPERLPDGNFNASSFRAKGFAASSGRLYKRTLNAYDPQKQKGAWCARDNRKGEYLQIDLGKSKTINAVATQGLDGLYEFVQTFSLELSSNGTEWKDYQENGDKKIFTGNCDIFTPVINILKAPVQARFIRFYPIKYWGAMCMRVEAYGC